ncbi:hypothetical protein [Hypericibacter sp.]|uniref:hypothetical protein n=1 Tax=Hypericibacter sp. TaxID=2705401 RepID=UPI003D6C9FE7
MHRYLGLSLGFMLLAIFMLGGLAACSSDSTYDNDGYNRAPHHHNMGGEGPGSKH